ncbi:MAG TPA: hypothetical protein VFO01_11410 [Trebonia sp.]|nr:hypothetical protein [Trebonia sp.]
MTSPGAGGPVLLVVAGGGVSRAAIARTAELSAGAPVTVVGIGTTEISRTDAGSASPLRPAHRSGAPGQRVPSPRPVPQAGGAWGTLAPAGLAGGTGGRASLAGEGPEQARRAVALAMSVLEDTGLMATGHIVTEAPARAVARVARARGARVVILDQPGASSVGQPVAGLMAELRRRMYGSGVVVVAETDRRGGWVSA